MDDEHIISAGDSVLLRGSSHQRRKIDEHSTSAVNSICSCGDSTHRRRKMDAIENEHNTSAGDGGLCSGSIHRRRRTTADEEDGSNVFQTAMIYSLF